MDHLLSIRPRGEDGHRVVSLRIRVSILEKLDELAAKTNRSRNEVANLLLEYGVRCAEVEEP